MTKSLVTLMAIEKARNSTTMAPTAIPSCLCWKSIVFDTGLRPEVIPAKASTVSKVVARPNRKKNTVGERDEAEADISEDSDPNEETDGESEFTSGVDSDQDGESDSDSGDEPSLPVSAVFPSFFKGKAWGYSTVVVNNKENENDHHQPAELLEPPTINTDYKLTKNKPGFSVYHTIVENAPAQLQHEEGNTYSEHHEEEYGEHSESDERGNDSAPNSVENSNEEELLHLNIGFHHGEIEGTDGTKSESGEQLLPTIGFSFNTPTPVPIYLPAFEAGSDASGGQPQLVLVPAEYFHHEYLPGALDAFANNVDLSKTTKRETKS